MQNTAQSLSIPSLVSIHNGKPTTTSNAIAKTFGKRHADVLRAVKTIDCSDVFRQRNFALTYTEVPGPKNSVRKEPSFIVSRDGFVFLAMGFTGAEAAKWKEAYIEAFNQMEERLKTSGPQRLLMTIENGKISNSQPIPNNAMVIDPDNATAIKELILNYLPFTLLETVLQATTERLHQFNVYTARRNDAALTSFVRFEAKLKRNEH